MTAARSGRIWLLVAVGLVVLGAVLRVQASRTDFWLDEILTLDWPRRFGYWDLIADPRTKHDNNHVLNSWWLRLVESFGEPDHWLPYRLLSIVTGVVMAAGMGRIGWLRSPAEGALAAGLGSLSYVMIHYGSECRGYASVCCFAVLSWLAVERYLRRPGLWVALGFWVCAVLGVLSHSTYAFAYIGFCVWSLAGWRAALPGAGWAGLLRLHAVPFAFLALIYFSRINGMTIGGGPEFGLPRVLVNTLAHVVGWAWTRDWVGYVFAAAALGLILAECGCRLRRVRQGERDPSLGFYLALVVVTPLLTALVLTPKVVFMRYFLVCMPFLLLLVAGLCARGWRCCALGRVAVGTLLLALLCLNGWRMDGMLRAGRGQYLAALQYIATHDPGDPGQPILVKGDAEFHIQRIIGYYQKFLGRQIRYLPSSSSERPDWLISETQVALPMVANGIQRRGEFYALRGRYEYASMSGAHWYLFERER